MKLTWQRFRELLDLEQSQQYETLAESHFDGSPSPLWNTPNAQPRVAPRITQTSILKHTPRPQIKGRSDIPASAALSMPTVSVPNVPNEPHGPLASQPPLLSNSSIDVELLEKFSPQDIRSGSRRLASNGQFDDVSFLRDSIQAGSEVGSRSEDSLGRNQVGPEWSFPPNVLCLEDWEANFTHDSMDLPGTSVVLGQSLDRGADMTRTFNHQPPDIVQWPDLTAHDSGCCETEANELMSLLPDVVAVQSLSLEQLRIDTDTVSAIDPSPRHSAESLPSTLHKDVQVPSPPSGASTPSLPTAPTHAIVPPHLQAIRDAIKRSSPPAPDASS